MNTLSVQIEEQAQVAPSAAKPGRAGRPVATAAPKLRWRTLLAAPVSALIALGVHLAISRNEPAIQTTTYTTFLAAVLGLTLLSAAAHQC